MTFLVPTMIYVLLDFPDLKKYDLSSMRNIIYGASAIAPERLKQALNTFGPIFSQLFGQTEAPMMLSFLSREEHIIQDPQREKEVLSSAGRPTFHAEIKLVDENGNEVKRGETGEVIARCENMMTGYFKNPEATAETINYVIARSDGFSTLMVLAGMLLLLKESACRYWNGQDWNCKA